MQFLAHTEPLFPHPFLLEKIVRFLDCLEHDLRLITEFENLDFLQRKDFCQKFRKNVQKIYKKIFKNLEKILQISNSS